MEDTLSQLRYQQLQITSYVSDTEARAKTVLSTAEVWKKCRNAEDGIASTVCDATKNMFACPWSCPRSHQNFSGKGRHSNATWNKLWKRLYRALTGPTLRVGRVFLCIFNTARLVGSMSNTHGYAVLFLDTSRGPAFDVGQPGVASTVLGWRAAGRVLGLWSVTPSLDSVQRNSLHTIMSFSAMSFWSQSLHFHWTTTSALENF